MSQILHRRELHVAISAEEAGAEFASAPADVQAKFLEAFAASVNGWTGNQNWPMQCRHITDELSCDPSKLAAMLRTLIDHLENKITEPGIYEGFDIDAYFDDPCPEPSLSQSIAKIILEKSPAHAMYAHPRLNKIVRADDDEKFNGRQAIGSAAHKLILGRGQEIVICDFDDWRKKAAQEARDDAIANGCIPVLARQMEQVEGLASIFRATMRAHDGLLWNPDDIISEAVIAWKEGPFWCRSMIDAVTKDLLVITDIKTSSASVPPQDAGKKMAEDGWDIQGAMLDRGLNAIDPANAGRRTYRFISIEQAPPFGIVVNELKEGVLTLGRKKLDRATDLWKRCLSENRWPGYPPVINYPEHPAYHVKEWEERELSFLVGSS